MSPVRPWFPAPISPVRPSVRTPDFHSGERSSILLRGTNKIRSHSSVGRAPALQAGGHRFKSCCDHQISPVRPSVRTPDFHSGERSSILLRGTNNGEIPEWPKGADCKSAGSAFEGSNPSLTTIIFLKLGL